MASVSRSRRARQVRGRIPQRRFASLARGWIPTRRLARARLRSPGKQAHLCHNFSTVTEQTCACAARLNTFTRPLASSGALPAFTPTAILTSARLALTRMPLPAMLVARSRARVGISRTGSVCRPARPAPTPSIAPARAAAICLGLAPQLARPRMHLHALADTISRARIAFRMPSARGSERREG